MTGNRARRQKTPRNRRQKGRVNPIPSARTVTVTPPAIDVLMTGGVASEAILADGEVIYLEFGS